MDLKAKTINDIKTHGLEINGAVKVFCVNGKKNNKKQI